MLVFVDESGDAGMKLGRGSSSHFVAVAVLFEDHDEALRCSQRIDTLRHELGLPPHREFHYSKSNAAIRGTFFQAVGTFQFFFLAIVINKKLLTGPGFQFKESFYKYTVSLVFTNAKPYLSDATVTIDRSGGHEFRAQLERYLKRKMNEKDGPKTIKKVKTEPSHTNNLLQLADMICGAVARCYKTNRADCRENWKQISHRALHVQVWPSSSRRPQS